MVEPGGRADERWKNPAQVIAFSGWNFAWLIIQAGSAGARVAASMIRFVVAIPTAITLGFVGSGVAIWRFSERPFPALGDESFAGSPGVSQSGLFIVRCWSGITPRRWWRC